MYNLPATLRTFMTRFRSLLVLSIFIGLAGCSSPLAADATPTVVPATYTPAPPPTVTPIPTLTPTATPLGCLTQRGKVEGGSTSTTRPPQQFLIYLPPCYDQQADQRYPVLYLLHGQTSTDTQWVDMGAPNIADHLIHSGQVAPFIIVFPDDRYWNLPAGPGFGDRLLTLVVPYIDAHYRTLADAPHRALGGISRGGGWAIHMALTQYSTFGIIGLHSPVIFDDDSAVLNRLFAAVPSNAWPHMWIDGGDRDGELGNILRFENMLTAYEVPHEWRLYSGDHTERYWSAHIPEYLRWYTQQFAATAGTATPTLTP
jgi:enterochelin esterase-like enzyme